MNCTANYGIQAGITQERTTESDSRIVDDESATYECWMEDVSVNMYVEGGCALEAARLYAPTALCEGVNSDQGIEIIVEQEHNFYVVVVFSDGSVYHSFDLCSREDWPEYSPCEFC